MTEFMYVCICNAVTEQQIRRAMDAGVDDLWGLQRELGVTAGCGACREMASAMLNERRSANKHAEPTLYQPSSAA